MDALRERPLLPDGHPTPRDDQRVGYECAYPEHEDADCVSALHRTRTCAFVPEELRRDYNAAAAILDASPSMSAVMSRSVLADLLETYCKYDDFSLATRIEKFRADTSQGLVLRDNMQHFREIADFGAHTQKNDQDVIIPVNHADAEWMLGFLDRCFEHLIIAPEKDRFMRETWDKNIADAGRNAIPPVEDS